jgi:PD-(D/E)XK nuclease superfamily
MDWISNEELNECDSSVPNLFAWATKELSQDAFLCWLICWARPNYREKHPELHKTGVALLNKLLKKCKIAVPTDYVNVKIKQQHKGIDIRLLINDETIALVIEDKKRATQREDQLERYKHRLETDFPDAKRGFVYLKVADPTFAELETIEEADYKLFRRHELLEVLEEGEKLGIKNDIFRAYLFYLRDYNRCERGRASSSRRKK